MGGLAPLRWSVFGLVAVAALMALLCALVQRRLLNPFGRPARLIRDLTDPVIRPIERRVLRAGGNPQSAPWWLLGAAIVGGILVITLTEWLVANGAKVQQGDPIYALETGKSVQDITAPASGTLVQKVAAGGTLDVGTEIGEIV